MRFASLTALVAGLVVVGCRGRPGEVRRPPAALPRNPGVAVQGPPEVLRSNLARAYALQVDRRLLRAFDEVARLAGRACPSTAAARREGDGWRVSACGQDVGPLPADPDLPDALTLLERFAAGQPRAPAPSASASALRPVPLRTADAALAEVARLERGAPPYAPAELQALSASLAVLAFAVPDTMEVADELPARALAALALERARGDVDTGREEALVGAAMGYGAAARAAAKRLAADDPVRAYVERDDATLAGLAEHGDPAVRLLWVRRLAEVDTDRAEDARSPTREAPLGAAAERARIETFDVERDAGRELVSRVLGGPGATVLAGRIGKLQVKAGIAPWRWNGGPSLARLERVLEHATPDQQAFLRACFFAGVALQADFALQRRADPEEGAALLEGLGSEEVGPAGEGLRRWLTLRVAAARGGRDAGATLEGVDGLAGLGGYPRVDLFLRAGHQLDHGDPALAAGLRKLVEWLDGRPRHRLWLAHSADQLTRDPRLKEESLRRAARVAGDPWSAAWVAKMDGDVGALRTIAGDARVDRATRSLAVGLLEKEGEHDEALEPLYRALLSGERDDWPERERLIGFLERHDRYPDAEALAREWLARRHPERGVRGAAARAALARVLSHQGRDAEALEVVQPALRSYTLAALKRGALALAALGRDREARELAEALEARYPGARGAAAHAAVLWRLHDADGAAQVLARDPAPRMLDWYQEIAPIFAEVLGGDPTGPAALDALRRRGIDPIALAHLPAAVFRAGHREPALAMAAGLRHPDPVGDLELAVTAYRYREAVEGRAAARAWLEKRVPAPLRAPLSMYAFSMEREELLWDLIPAPAGTSEQDDFVWLMFAAASLRVPPTPAQSAALAARFADARPGWYHHVGRFLLGFEGPEQVMKGATGRKHACEGAYYLGLRAERSGDVATAIDWYRAAVENGTPRDGEYRWASGRLGEWTDADRSLLRLAAEAKAGNGRR